MKQATWHQYEYLDCVTKDEVVTSAWSISSTY
jgi:hypothetical protein